MATVTEYRATMKVRDSRNKSTEVTFRVSAADAAAWLTAANPTARGLTEIGVAFNAILPLLGVFAYSRDVRLVDEADNVTHPPADDNIYNFDKIAVGYQSSIDNYVMTLPGRDDEKYNVADDGVTIITSGAGATTETTDFITAIEAVLLGKNGGAGTVTKMYVQK